MATIEKRSNSSGIQYRVKIRIKGFPDQTASFERLTDARRWAQSTEAAIRERRYFKTNEALRHLLADAIDRYIVEVLPQKAPSSQGPQKLQLQWWKACIGKYSIAEVTPSLISEYRNKLASEPIKSQRKSTRKPAQLRFRGPATIVRYMAVLSHLFGVAIKDWEWASDNPLEKVRKPVLHSRRKPASSCSRRWWWMIFTLPVWMASRCLAIRWWKSNARSGARPLSCGRPSNPAPCRNTTGCRCSIS